MLDSFSQDLILISDPYRSIILRRQFTAFRFLTPRQCFSKSRSVVNELFIVRLLILDAFNKCLHINGHSSPSSFSLQTCFNGNDLSLQKAQLRCLLPKSLLEHGFFAAGHPKDGSNDNKWEVDRISSFSWSGQRRMPSYLNKLVFPENFLTALRTIAMQEDEISKVSSLLEEVQLLSCIFSSKIVFGTSVIFSMLNVQAFLVCISLFSCLQIAFPNNVSIQVASIVYWFGFCVQSDF